MFDVPWGLEPWNKNYLKRTSTVEQLSIASAWVSRKEQKESVFHLCLFPLGILLPMPHWPTPSRSQRSRKFILWRRQSLWAQSRTEWGGGWIWGSKNNQDRSSLVYQCLNRKGEERGRVREWESPWVCVSRCMRMHKIDIKTKMRCFPYWIIK